jgi:hypothetical protein
VAAHADDVTQSDLVVESFGARAVVCQHRHRRELACNMVELEHHRICLATVDAWMRGQVLQNVRLGPPAPTPACIVGLPTMQIATLGEVVARA